MAAEQDPPHPRRPRAGDTPGDGIPVAVVVLDGAAVIAHWNTGAAGLFDVPRAAAVGRRAVDVMPVASVRDSGPAHTAVPDDGGPLDPAHRRETIFGTDMTTFAAATAGMFSTRGSGARPYRRDLLWWAYPLRGPGTARVLLLAVDSAAVRRTGRDAFAPALGAHDGPPDDPARLHGSLAGLLLGMREEDAGHIARQVVAYGYPYLELRDEARWEPVTPDWGTAAPDPDPAADTPAPEAPPPPAAPLAPPELLDLLRAIGGGAGTDLAGAVEALGRSLVPRFADIAGTYLREQAVTGAPFPAGPTDATTRWLRVALAHSHDGVRAAGRADRPTALPAGTPFAECVTTGRPVLVPRLTEADARAVAAPLGARDAMPPLTRRSLLTVPLMAGRSVFGFLVLLRHPERPGFTRADLTAAADIADRAGPLLDNARLRALHAEPPGPPPAPLFACETASRLLPGARIGGATADWSDAIRLPGCRTALVAGRALGHAPAHRLRTVVQTLAAQEPDPAHLLRSLDDLVHRLGGLPLATCLFAVHDPIRSELRVATAGHLPPVLIPAHGAARALDLPVGAPVGVGGVPFTTVTVPVTAGDRLVLCTDGLAEVRGRHPGVRLAALCDAAVRGQDPADDLCDAVARALAAVTPAGARDAGTTLLTARLGRVAPRDTAFWRLGLDASYVPHARSLVRMQLRDWGLEAVADTATLLVSELVTNALSHARRGPVELRLVRADTLLCEVTDDGHERPLLLDPSPTDESGRGLQVVSRLARSWGSGHTDHGTTVWCEQDLPHRP
ncbi:ATP-binding SpoIIE family protein phosphatase [Streptomyces avicenniae]|uniref:ATP-binding SpoIIE family protein phosphatase n=1 Tax=Streptomyces avicenniae TaxID=500153 RepID=UPI00069B524F|nr:SpoIIE family protein phosphatase [Streptomyces avicenniae]